jgi:hypothetical protein
MNVNKNTVVWVLITLLGLHLMISRSVIGATLGFCVGVLASDKVKAWMARGRIQYLIYKQRWSGTLTQPAMPPPPE